MGDTDDVNTAAQGSAVEADVIQVVLPLRAEFGATLRVVVASLGADAGFTVDEIDDLRLGVSEVFTLLVDTRAAHDRCVARFEIATDQLSVTLSRRGDETPDQAPELDPLASTILASVVDEYHEQPDGLRLVKRATESATSND